MNTSIIQDFYVFFSRIAPINAHECLFFGLLYNNCHLKIMSGVLARKQAIHVENQLRTFLDMANFMGITSFLLARREKKGANH